MAKIKLMGIGLVALALLGCDRNASETSRVVTEVAVDSIELKQGAPAGLDGLERASLDTLMWLTKDDGFITAEGIDMDDIAERIERTAKAMVDVPHVDACRKRLGTGDVEVSPSDGKSETASATWLCDIDWPDSSLDPNRHIRHMLHDNVVAMLKAEFPGIKDTVRVYRQPLDDCGEMLSHYAGQYAKAYKQAATMAAASGTKEAFEDYGEMALIIKLRAYNDEWATYYIAAMDDKVGAKPYYGIVSINRNTGALLKAGDIVAEAEGWNAKLQSALNKARTRQGEPPMTIGKETQYTLGLTPQHLVVNFAPVKAADKDDVAGCVVYFKLIEQ